MKCQSEPKLLSSPIINQSAASLQIDDMLRLRPQTNVFMVWNDTYTQTASLFPVVLPVKNAVLHLWSGVRSDVGWQRGVRVMTKPVENSRRVI